MRYATTVEHTLELDNGQFVLLAYAPLTHVDPIVLLADEEDRDYTIVGYLTDCAEADDPMDSYANGRLVTKGSLYGRNQRDTDDHDELARLLQADDICSITLYAGQPGAVGLGEKAADMILASLSHQAIWDLGVDMCDTGYVDTYPNGDMSAWLNQHHSEAVDYIANGNAYEGAFERNCQKLYTEHWRELVGPFVVPVSVNDERGSVRVFVTSWDGDSEELPDGIWVADDDAIEEIRARVAAAGESDIPMARREELTAIAYASEVLDEYSAWASGETYGAVVQCYDIDGLQIGETDEVFGLIGQKYAEEELASMVENAKTVLPEA